MSTFSSLKSDHKIDVATNIVGYNDLQAVRISCKDERGYLSIGETKELIGLLFEALAHIASDGDNEIVFVSDHDGDLGCFGANEEHCDTIKKCAAIARGQ
jgi:hypothetical protein